MVSDVSLPDWFFKTQTQDIEVVNMVKEDEPLNQEEQEQSEIMDDHLPL